jgi:hypothetical protein
LAGPDGVEEEVGVSRSQQRQHGPVAPKGNAAGLGIALLPRAITGYLIIGQNDLASFEASLFMSFAF